MNLTKASLAKLRTRLGDLAAAEGPPAAPQAARPPPGPPSPEAPVLSPHAEAADREAKQALLQARGRPGRSLSPRRRLLMGLPCVQALPPCYFDKSADAVRQELLQLTVQDSRSQLDDAADARTAVLDVRPAPRALRCCRAALARAGSCASAFFAPGSGGAQVVGELLSHHILQNYDKFVAGIESISAIELELASLLQIAQARCLPRGSRPRRPARPDAVRRGPERAEGPGPGQAGDRGGPAGRAGRPAEGALRQAAGHAAAPALCLQPGRRRQVLPQRARLPPVVLCRPPPLPPTTTTARPRTGGALRH